MNKRYPISEDLFVEKDSETETKKIIRTVWGIRSNIVQ
jgi:hypothetical protein